MGCFRESLQAQRCGLEVAAAVTPGVVNLRHWPASGIACLFITQFPGPSVISLILQGGSWSQVLERKTYNGHRGSETRYNGILLRS